MSSGWRVLVQAQAQVPDLQGNVVEMVVLDNAPKRQRLHLVAVVLLAFIVARFTDGLKLWPGRGVFSVFRRHEASQSKHRDCKDKGEDLLGVQKTETPPDDLYWEAVKAILWFEPPVGALALLLVWRLVWSGRIFRIDSTAVVASADGAWREAETKKYKRSSESSSRAMRLDQDDQFYYTLGGIQRIRRALCWAALHKEPTPPTSEQQLKLARDALFLVYFPHSGRAGFVETICKPLCLLNNELTSTNSGDGSRTQSSDALIDEDLLLRMSATVCEIRMHDALLRLTRDRLITTCSRLQRTVRHWDRRIRLNKGVAVFLGRFLHQTRYNQNTQGYHLRLSLAKAAFEAEKSRLGNAQRLLVERPSEMTDAKLLLSLSDPPFTGETHETVSATATKSQKNFSLRMPTLAKLTLRWNDGGSGMLTLNRFDNNVSLSSTNAWKALLEGGEVDSKDWIEEAQQWVRRARCIVVDCVHGSLSGTRVVDGHTKVTEIDLKSMERWRNSTRGEANAVESETDWKTVLSLVSSLDERRRVGEGEQVAIGRDISRGIGQFDMFGIPSTIVLVWLTRVLRSHLVPFWPQFCDVILHAVDIGWSIVQKRFWKPVHGIVTNLLSTKSRSITDNFDLENEEHSLDNLLRDLGLGDGLEGSRREALHQASRAYEKSLKSGALRGVIRGRLVRLLLVQIQQLKAGLLRALYQIDVLVDANKLNLQILAVVPSVLIVTIFARVLLRLVVVLRARDIRPLDDVHEEMADCLENVEKALVLARPNETVADAHVKTCPSPMLQSRELGEVVVQIHSYLVLLDYCSPPFPIRNCDMIQTTLQEILTLQGSRQALETNQVVALLQVVKQKHKDLRRYI